MSIKYIEAINFRLLITLSTALYNTIAIVLRYAYMVWLKVGKCTFIIEK